MPLPVAVAPHDGPEYLGTHAIRQSTCRVALDGEMVGGPGFEPGASRSWPVRRRHRVGAQKVGPGLTVAASRCIGSAKRPAAARSEAETVICRPQLAALGIQNVARGRTVSRVLYPLWDGDHLSAAPVSRRL